MRTRSAKSNYFYMPPQKYVKGRDEWPSFEPDSRILPRAFCRRETKMWKQSQTSREEGG
jgi:hypothetical protein